MMGPLEAAPGALTRPQLLEPPEGDDQRPQVELVRALVFLLLVLDVLPYRRFVPTYGRDSTKLRFLSPYVRAKWIALLPLIMPTT